VSGVLLDTHVIVWLGEKVELRKEARAAINSALMENAAFISVISGWEIAQLFVHGRISMQVPPAQWIERFLAITGCSTLPLTLESAIAAALLPSIHRDPADRFLIATAVLNGLTLVTRDTTILDYAETGHVRAIAC
jgi:PIN domain nuclease of toxin-antitoxin system